MIKIIQVFPLNLFNNFLIGNINHIQFSYILTEIVGISADDLEKIIKEIDPTHLNIIKYYDFLNLVYSNSKKKDHKF